MAGHTLSSGRVEASRWAAAVAQVSNSPTLTAKKRGLNPPTLPLIQTRLLGAMVKVNAVLSAHAILGAERLAAVLGREGLNQAGICVELRLAAVELLAAIQHNLCATLKATHGAANLNIFIDQRSQVADIICIRMEADDGEVAGVVEGLRAAHIKKARALRRRNHRVDVGSDAHVLIYVLQRLIGRDAWFGFGRAEKRSANAVEEAKQAQRQRRLLHHDPSPALRLLDGH